MIYGIVIILLIISLIIGITISSFIKKDNNPMVKVGLDLIMFQIKNKIVDLEKLDDKEYIELALKICKLISEKGNITEDEHYFRNYFSRCPETLDEMVDIIKNTENNVFGWKLVSWKDTAFHMYGKDGEYNLKFLSADGHFEAVYNRNEEKLTEENDILNMATFNYGDYQTENMKHLKYDVQTYFEWNNTKEAMELFKDKKVINPQPIDKNEDAMKRYKEYEEILNKN